VAAVLQNGDIYWSSLFDLGPKKVDLGVSAKANDIVQVRGRECLASFEDGQVVWFKIGKKSKARVIRTIELPLSAGFQAMAAPSLFWNTESGHRGTSSNEKWTHPIFFNSQEQEAPKLWELDRLAGAMDPQNQLRFSNLDLSTLLDFKLLVIDGSQVFVAISDQNTLIVVSSNTQKVFPVLEAGSLVSFGILAHQKRLIFVLRTDTGLHQTVFDVPSNEFNGHVTPINPPGFQTDPLAFKLLTIPCVGVLLIWTNDRILVLGSDLQQKMAFSNVLSTFLDQSSILNLQYLEKGLFIQTKSRILRIDLTDFVW
jgi:hypothetical protein